MVSLNTTSAPSAHQPIGRRGRRRRAFLSRPITCSSGWISLIQQWISLVALDFDNYMSSYGSGGGAAVYKRGRRCSILADGPLGPM